MRGRDCISHHIFSSIWSGLKNEFKVILNNASWLIGNGEKINFWTDNWCGLILADTFQVDVVTLISFPVKVKDYIINKQWCIPTSVLALYPTIQLLVTNVIIPFEDKTDQLIWKHTTSGNLYMKDAFLFKKKNHLKLSWTKHIWCKDIPPSKATLVWRLMLNKLPANENLSLRGCSFPSMCSLCSSTSETSFLLFFECAYAVKLWCWLATKLNSPLHFQSKEDIWSLSDKFSNKHCKITINSALVFILNAIWFARNQLRFNNKIIPWRSSITNIAASIQLTGNCSRATSISMSDFVLLKKFNVTIHPPRAPVIKEVFWNPLLANWIKCNADDSSVANNSACGGIFRDANVDFLFCFAENTGQGNA